MSRIARLRAGYRNQLDSLFSDSEFLALLRRPTRIALERGDNEDRIFSPTFGYLRTLVFVDRIVFVSALLFSDQCGIAGDRDQNEADTGIEENRQ